MRENRGKVMKAADVMTTNVITVGTEASVLEAVRLMLQNKISGLPVVDGEGLLVGIVTEGDFLRGPRSTPSASTSAGLSL